MLQPVSSRAAGFPTKPRLSLWEIAVAKVLNRQRAAAATKQQCHAQAAAVSSVAAIYACGNITRAGCSRRPSRYSARRRLRPHRPGVVHDGLARFLSSRHDRVQCVPHVLSHDARPERRAVGVTRLGPDGIFLYFDLALSSHRDCGFFRASVRLARSLLEHPKLTQ